MINKSRRTFLKQASVIGLTGAIGFPLFGKSSISAESLMANVKRRKKNVLFIIADDLRVQLNCYGQTMIKSPNIDKLASEGMLFERNYCQQAVCAPSRASLLTGRRPDTTKIYDLKTHIRTTMPDVVTLQQYFKNNGYFSEGMGKLFHVGFEDPISYSVPHRYPPGNSYATEENLNLLKEGGKESTKNSGSEDEAERMRAHAFECADVPDNAYLDGNLADMAIEALNRLSVKAMAADEKDRIPFFLGVGFRKPHLPFCAPKKYWDMYDRSKIPLPYPDKPKDAPEIAFTKWGELRTYFGIPDEGNLSKEQTLELIHAYYACVSYMDALVGKVLSELDRLGLRKDTIVVLWGDNGWKLGEYSQWSKHTNFELDTHVPLIIADPDMPKGERTSALVESVDLYPTLVDLCGLPMPDGLEGTSVEPLMEGPQRTWKKAAFSQYPRGKKIMGYSIRTDQYRYTEWQDRKKGDITDRELYDLSHDPLGKENLALKPENEKLIVQLHEILEAGWVKSKP